ncbi:MAG: FAD/NAD(P)-binding protein [candidate division WOR-3 bacterium]
MNNPYRSIPAEILQVIEETPNIKTFVLKPKETLQFEAGQFVELTVPGVGEAPFTPSSSPFVKETLELTIMRVGRVTNELFKLKAGDWVGIRGPYGQRYPLENFENKEVFIVGGGVGLAPLRSLFLALTHEIKKYKKIYLRYGARTPQDIVYKSLLAEWKTWKGVDVLLTVDVGDKSWKGKVGVVTVILDKIPVDFNNSVAVVCGPPIMMKFVTQRLLEAGFAGKDIYLSMEKNMSCGLGQCGHCRIGRYFTCKDGPVLTWKQIKDIEEPFL